MAVHIDRIAGEATVNQRPHADASAAAGVVTSWSAIAAEAVRPGVTRKGFGNEHVTLVMNVIEPRMEPRPHRHDDFDQIATIVAGHALYHVGDAAHRVGPGSLLLIPAGVEHWIEPAGDEPVENLDVFAPPRDDYRHLVAWMDPNR